LRVNTVRITRILRITLWYVTSVFKSTYSDPFDINQLTLTPLIRSATGSGSGGTHR
jgi:hypothetical protein